MLNSNLCYFRILAEINNPTTVLWDLGQNLGQVKHQSFIFLPPSTDLDARLKELSRSNFHFLPPKSGPKDIRLQNNKV